MKRQRGEDPIDLLGGNLPEVSAAVELSYPGGGRQHDTYFDPLQPLAGPIADVTPGRKKGKKKPGALSAQQESESKARRLRYDTFIDELVKNSGDEVAALAATYGVMTDEIQEKLLAYRTDVALGISSSSVGELMERMNIGKSARVRLLAKHVFSQDDKVSLVALKMATELDGDKHDTGTSYETYLRMVMSK